LLWAIGTEKTIDLPRMMFLFLCTAYKASDKRGSVPFTGFLTKLFKRSGVHIPLDITKIELEGAIDRSSLSRSKGQKKKRRLEAGEYEEPSMGMAELKEAIMNLGIEMGVPNKEMITYTAYELYFRSETVISLHDCIHKVEIYTEKTIDLPRMMFLFLCTAYKASDKRGSVPFTGFLTKLFKRSGVHIPLDITKIELEGAIDRSSLSRSKGQKKKRRLEAGEYEEPSMGMAELKEAIMNLGIEMGVPNVRI
ncbi:Transient receptor potential cation channel subfamily V member 4 like, partial [Actinidia chinensis var. chinensis]